MTPLQAMIRFELSRVLTAGRIVWWLILASFPILITGLIRFFQMSDPAAARNLDKHVFWYWTIYLLVPCITCALGVLLSAGPAISTELEQRSWVYLATRPNGIFWMLLGKYVVAFCWATTAAVAGLSVAVLFSMQETLFRIWMACAGLSVLAAMSYAAVFLLIGTIFPQRSMLFCVVWAGFAEGIISLIPAVINRITVQYRLRTLFVQWARPGGSIDTLPILGESLAEGPWYIQILWLLSLTAVFLATAQVVAHRREFTSAAESDV